MIMDNVYVNERKIGAYSIGGNELKRIKGVKMSEYIDDYNALVDNDVIEVIIEKNIKK